MLIYAHYPLAVNYFSIKDNQHLIELYDQSECNFSKGKAFVSR